MSKEVLDWLDRPIAFQRSFVSLGVGVTGALMLSQAIYWTRRAPNGWFWKTMDEWEAETGLTRTEQETARSRLRNIGVLLERKRGIPCKTWFAVDAEALQTRLRESCNLDCGKAANSDAGKPQPTSETTSETTSEKKDTRASLAVRPEDVDPDTWTDFLAMRKAKRAPLTKTGLSGIQREADKARMTLQDALQLCCARGWQGFNAGWLTEKPKFAASGQIGYASDEVD